MKQGSVLNRIGPYKVSVTGNLDDTGTSVGFKVSLPSEIAEKWGFTDEVAREREKAKNRGKKLSGKHIDLKVILYADRIDNNLVLIVADKPLPGDILS